MVIERIFTLKPNKSVRITTKVCLFLLFLHTRFDLCIHNYPKKNYPYVDECMLSEPTPRWSCFSVSFALMQRTESLLCISKSNIIHLLFCFMCDLPLHISFSHKNSTTTNTAIYVYQHAHSALINTRKAEWQSTVWHFSSTQAHIAHTVE